MTTTAGAKSSVRYATHYADGAVLLGHGLDNVESAKRWSSWLRDVQFRPGALKLMEQKYGQWTEVPLGS